MGDAPFVTAARAQTMLRDFDRLRRAIRAHDPEASEQAFEKVERWIALISPNPEPPKGKTDE